MDGSRSNLGSGLLALREKGIRRTWKALRLRAITRYPHVATWASAFFADQPRMQKFDGQLYRAVCRRFILGWPSRRVRGPTRIGLAEPTPKSPLPRPIIRVTAPQPQKLICERLCRSSAVARGAKSVRQPIASARIGEVRGFRLASIGWTMKVV